MHGRSLCGNKAGFQISGSRRIFLKKKKANISFRPGARFSISDPKSQSKISNLTISELFYSHIFNMKRGPLRTRSFRLIQFSAEFSDTDERKMALRARNVSGAFEKRAPEEWGRSSSSFT